MGPWQIGLVIILIIYILNRHKRSGFFGWLFRRHPAVVTPTIQPTAPDPVAPTTITRPPLTEQQERVRKSFNLTVDEFYKLIDRDTKALAQNQSSKRLILTPEQEKDRKVKGMSADEYYFTVLKGKPPL